MCSGAKPDLPPMPSSLSLEGLATLVLAYLPLPWLRLPAQMKLRNQWEVSSASFQSRCAWKGYIATNFLRKIIVIP